MKTIFRLFLVSLVLFVCALSTTLHADAPIRSGAYLLFTAEGHADPIIPNETQRQAMANQAAIVEGQKQIALYVDGLRIKKTRLTIKESLAQDPKIKTTIDAFIQGAQVVNSEWDGAETAKVTLKIHRRNLLKKLKAVEP